MDGPRVDSSVGGEDDEVAADGCSSRIDAYVVGFARKDNVIEDLLEGGDLGTYEGQVPVVDQVGNVNAVCVEHSANVGYRFDCREMPWDAHTSERVADDEITAARGELAQAQPAVLDTYVDSGL